MKQAQAILQAPAIKKTALFLDFDGVLAHHDAESRIIPPSTLALLSNLQKKNGGALAVISGYTIADLDRLLAPLPFVASGCLGAEMRMTPDGEIYALAERMPDSAIDALRLLAQRLPGVTLENKRFGACLSYDKSLYTDEQMEKQLAAIRPLFPRHLKTAFTPYGCEIKRHNFNKGSAVRNFFLSPTFKGKMPVYVGNDILDHDAFTAARAMGGVGMYVGKDYVNPEIDFAMKSLEDIQQWLDGV